MNDSASTSVAISLAWFTWYPRTNRLWPPYPTDLRDAYRPGPFLVAGLQQAGVQVRAMTCDERLTSGFAQSLPAVEPDQVTFLHIACHGTFDQDRYAAILEGGTWEVASESLPCDVLVLETCSAIDSTRNWSEYWESCAAASNLRLVLGYDRAVTMDRAGTRRGYAFAEELLRGLPIADAWLKAFESTRVYAADRPIAIGFGDDFSDAMWSLHDLKINGPPLRRSGPTSVVVLGGGT